MALYERAGSYGTAQLKLGRLREQAGQHSAARELYCQYLNAIFTENGSYLYRSQVRWRIDEGDLEGALALCEVALEVFNESEPTQELAEIVTELGRVREEAGDYTGAEDAYRRAAEGRDSEAAGRLSWLRKRNGDTDAAAAIERDGLDADRTAQGN
ncbi:hypothetical protein ACWGQ5_56465 [Streptomyces sp. NPDC055722]